MNKPHIGVVVAVDDLIFSAAIPLVQFCNVVRCVVYYRHIYKVVLETQYMHVCCLACGYFEIDCMLTTTGDGFTLPPQGSIKAKLLFCGSNLQIQYVVCLPVLIE